jgi:PAS domain S-box-containing protein
VTLDGWVTSWNSGAERLFGYTAEDVIGHPISLLALPEHHVERPHMHERTEHFETVGRRKDGSEIVLSLTISPIRNSCGWALGT